ncbi:MAG: lysine--tRNA ligase [Candidatus Taylorbacteria bacterium]|nr:lysine--tRNA ligase [Candidatus Taylorbacteria bacterium]
MFWGNEVLEKVRTRYKDKIERGEPIIIRDEKTASGRVHVGSLRGVAIHGVISELLTQAGIKNKYFFEINDFDVMDGLPVYLDQEKFKPFMGKPLCEVPSPDGKAKNYAEYFAQEFIGVIEELGFSPEFYRSSSMYRSGKYNEAIKIALENASLIRDVYKEVSGSQKEEVWLPISVICEKCGKVGTTQVSDFDGKTVAYSCGDYVEWAKGCGHNGRISPYDGNAKFSWKAEWAAKFGIYNVDVEGGGKDHSTRGGSRDVADSISRKVFKREPPINVPYEFFLVGGKKMSSSKGAGSSSREIADLLPPHVLRFLLAYKEPQKVIDFVPDGDTIPILFDTFDKYSENYFSGNKDDYAEAFTFSYSPKELDNIIKHANPRFSQVAYLTQMPHVDIYKEVEKLLGTKLDKESKKELELRMKYAKIWIDTYAPEDYKFEIQKNLPEVAKNLSDLQKKALLLTAEFIKSLEIMDGQVLHTRLHDLKAELGILPKDLYEAVYLSILGKTSGPKAGWFLSVLDKAFLVKRFEEVCK